MYAQEVAAVCLPEQILENTVGHDVVSRVPPVRGVVVDGFDVEAESSKEGYEAVGPRVGPREQDEDGFREPGRARVRRRAVSS